MTTTNVSRSKELLELAWGLIANAHGGDWSTAKPDQLAPYQPGQKRTTDGSLDGFAMQGEMELW